MTNRILVANRGEIACRVMRAARSLGYSPVAVHSEADAGALHVAMADEAVCIGPARPQQSYLDQDAVLSAARSLGAVAVHPGYGFLSENAEFARRCVDAGMVFVGPDPASITEMGDKARARRLAQNAGVPVVPGAELTGGVDAAAIAAAARRVGFPVIVKAAGGGGGIGLLPVDDPERLPAAVEQTSRMAERAFGDGSVFIERLIRSARHIEVQVFGFGDGHAVHLWDRDCSVQRRYQKIIEEGPAPDVAPAVRDAMHRCAVQLAGAVRYRGAGTIEFLYDRESEEFFFIEMNTRIQVEHPVTEMITGLDLVAMQIRQAFGENLGSSLRQEDIRAVGHAIEARLCAEQPLKKFIPSPGTLTEFVTPERDGIRADVGFRTGDKIGTHYDSLLGKIIAVGDDRENARTRLIHALRDMRISGLQSNRDYLIGVLDDEAFRNGDVDTRFVERRHEAIVAVLETTAA